MCNQWCIDFTLKAKTFLKHGINILEVGSLDVKGSVRFVFSDISSSYLGVDILDGPGVDMVINVADLTKHFEKESFDLVVSTEMLEHCFDWRNAIYQILMVLKKDGILILTTRSPGFELHDYPSDYWRFTREEMYHIFKDIGDLLEIEDDLTLGWPCGIGIVLRKTVDNNQLTEWINGINSFEVAKVSEIFDANLNINKVILFDQYSRYKACADILENLCTNECTILDVGSSEDCLLGEFLPNLKITYVDPLLSLHPDRSDNKIAGDIFAKELDGQLFDFVVSIDTLEHIPQEQRDLFVERLTKLARRGIILAFPCSDVGDALETDRWVNDVYFMAFGKNYKWLEEHFRHGLPSLSQVLDKFKTLGWQTRVARNGYTPWLKELLGFTLCALEIRELKPIVLELSDYFNKNLSRFDNQEPCYRQIIIASKNEFPDFSNKMVVDYELRNKVSRQWEFIRKRITTSSVQLSFNFEKMAKQLEEKNQALDAIYSSNLWKVGSLYFRLRDNTPILRYINKSLKVIKNEGFGVFLEKSGRKIREGAVGLWGRLRILLPLDMRGFPSAVNANKYDIIFFSIINWDFRFQRPQQIATRFSRDGHRVFYLSVNLKRQASYIKRQVADNIYEITLPFKENTTIYNAGIQEGLEMLAATLKALFEDFKIKESVAFVEFPLWYPLAERLKYKYGTKVVFDCLDEFPAFKGVGADIARVEDMLIKSSDYCIATSMKLYEKHKDKCKNIAIVRNATEFEHFHNLPPNDTLKDIQKPIIGYYGAIAEWFDTDTVEYLAIQRPEWSIVLIGHTFGSNINTLRKYKNIHLLSEKPYAELPKFLYWFNGCIIPFKLNGLILSTNPIKFYEFISSGKPVISSKLPELLPYADLLYLSENKEEFLENIELALKENDEDLIKRRIDLAKANDWGSRFYEIRSYIKTTYPLVSIVIVTFNNLEYTKLCIESIYSKTAYPNFELVIMDNASSDGTHDYLNAFKKEHDNIKVILNKENLGFAPANNIGIKESKGEYIILLNNDTVVTRGWISGLIKYLQNPEVGMVGPVTNSIGNEAKINVDYKNLSDIEMFADRYTTKNKGKTFEIPVLAMYCVALRRQTINKVGLLDEQFFIGMFEDDDYALRVRKAGLKILCTEDVFIHHFGGASFGKLLSAEYQRIFNENKKKYESKWGIKWGLHRYRD